MLYSLLALTITMFFIGFIKRQPPFSPVRMFLYGWLLVYFFAALGMVIYDLPLSAVTWGMLALTQTLFVLGAFLGNGALTHLCAQPPKLVRGQLDRASLLLLVLLALAAMLMIARDVLFGAGNFLLDDFAAGLGEIRNRNWDDFFSGEVGVSPLRSLFVASTLILAAMLPYAWRKHNIFLISVGFMSALLLIVDSLLAAGRFNIGILFLTLIVSASGAHGHAGLLRSLGVRKMTIGVVLGFYFFVIFPVQRNPYLADAVETSLQRGGDAYLSTWVVNASAAPGLSWVSVLAYSTSYFSGAIDKLNYFLTKTDIADWYGLGLYNFVLASQIYGLVSDEVSPWHSMRLRIADIMYREGWGLNPWATGVRDLVIDFGLVGSLAVVCLLGYLSQKLYRESFVNNGYVLKVAASLVSVGAFVFAFIGPFQIRLIVNSLLLLGLIAIIRQVILQAGGLSVRQWREKF